MKLFEYLKQALSADSAVSSKRISGFIGWIVCLLCVIYSVITTNEAPHIVDTLFITSTALLGLDSVVSIFKKE